MAAVVTATTTRRPMMTRPLPQHPSAPMAVSRKVSGSKRPHSPDPVVEPSTVLSQAKRVKAGELASAEAERLAKEQRRTERALRNADFKDKYTKSFPQWNFYFDLDHWDQETTAKQDVLKAKICHLGSRVDHFFSNKITHLITNQSVVPKEGDKENDTVTTYPTNRQKNSLNAIKRIGESAPVFDLVEKAHKFGMKIWNPSKLESVLSRCLDPEAISVSQPFPLAPPSTTVATAPHKRSLTRLLESERLHGVTSERDPTQKRHDFRYFPHAHYFVLVEDMRGELATIAAFEFSSKGEPAWPVLYCHPHARGPFYTFDEKEKRRWERALMRERDQEKEDLQRELQKQKQRQKRKALAELHANKGGDLRRSVSMINLQWRTNNEDMIDLDADECGPPELLDASGYFVSGAGAAYTAASGNSVGITSTTGTTSTTGLTSRTFQPLPSSLRGMIDNQVVTSRKVTAGTGQGKDKTGVMGPPTALPDRKSTLLRKSKSTNTMKLPTREEGTKPGYCENCRMTFDDYKEHLECSKHRKYATNEANFAKLDRVLARVQRRTRDGNKQSREELGFQTGPVGHFALALQETSDGPVHQPVQMQDSLVGPRVP